MKQRAFTLIELMLAVAIGMLVIYVAVAGLRVLSQAITRSHKMALDNSVMRIGMQIALNYTDFWTDRDNPLSNDPKDQYLRRVGKDNTGIIRGQAFTPFSVTGAAKNYLPTKPTPISTPVVAAGLNESQRGWDSNAWHAAAERTWFRANIVERKPNELEISQMLGRYHLLSAPETANGMPPADHPWQNRQATALLLSLGYYGLVDYLPANTPLISYVPDTNFNPNDAPYQLGGEWIAYSGGPFNDYEFGGEYGGSLCGGRKGVSDVAGFGIPNRNFPANQYPDGCYRNYMVVGSTLGDWVQNNGTANSGFQRLLEDAENVDAVLCESDPVTGQICNKPLAWPSLEVRTFRILSAGIFINFNRVIMTDPLTGQSTQFTFSAFGTTLRGARQQRANGMPGTASGWADPFSLTPVANLDSL